MEKGRTVEEVTSVIVKCRWTDEDQVVYARAHSLAKYIRQPRATPDLATYMATYNVAPRAGGSMATVSVSLETPSSSGVLAERDEDLTGQSVRALGELIEQ